MKANFNIFRYLAAFVPACLAIAGNLFGGNYVFMPIIYGLVILQLLDFLLPEDKTDPDLQTSDTLSTALLVGTVIFHTLVISTLLFGIYSGTLSGVFIWFAAVGSGINSGISGITVAHELIHRKESSLRNLGIWNLLLVNYTHFYVEHIKGHHRYVGTSKDPATAKFGESIYTFLARTVTGQFKSAYQIESSRLLKIDKPAFSLSNFVIKSLLAQLFVAISVFYVFGGIALAAYLLQSLVAIFLLEIVNYFEHYGLVRAENEKFGPEHAWQSNLTPSRYTLVELSRHSDHHLKASKHYQTLVSHAESPKMPTGYFGSYYLALIPPLWFKIMNPIVEKHYLKIKSRNPLEV